MAGVLRGSGPAQILMADLEAIRIRLVDEAGRFDLVVDAESDDYTDGGSGGSADQVINDAIEWLNSLRPDITNILSTASFALLVADTDENYWSENKPHLLVNAARRMLEVRHRNTAGVADWEVPIRTEVQAIYADEVQDEINADVTADAEARVMEG